MVLKIEHFGLYFARQAVENARKEREKVEHLKTAWQWLDVAEGEAIGSRETGESIIKPSLSPLGKAIENGFRYRFLDEQAAAESAWAFLQTMSMESLDEMMAAAHLAEMVEPLVSQDWRKNFAELSQTQLDTYETAEPVDKFWLIALALASGVVLEDEKRIEAGAALFRKTIDEQIHPEGYFKPLVEGAKEALPIFKKMLSGLGALSLAAEVGERLGLKLWQYEKRDVGLNTAASYLVYYYFYPDKWRWGTGLTVEDTNAAFREAGAFMEMLTSHVNPRGVELLLDEQRPFFSPYFGGLSSLSHYKTERRKRGFFG